MLRRPLICVLLACLGAIVPVTVAGVDDETGLASAVDVDGLTTAGREAGSSYYVLQPSGLEAESEGVFGNIAAAARGATSAGGDLAAATVATFDEVIGHVNARFPLRDAAPLDIPIPNGYNCYAPVGLYFAFDHGGAEGVERPLVKTIGDIDDVEFRIDYLRDVDVFIKQGDVEHQLAGSFAVNVYWRSQPPTLSLAASKTKLWGGERSSLTASLMCGDVAMEEQVLDFSLAAGSESSSLRPTSDATDAGGHADTVFVPGKSAAGPAVVEAAYEWSNQSGDIRATLTDTVELATGALTGTWRIRGRERATGCDNPSDNGTYSGSARVRFEQDGDRFTGYGRFPRETNEIRGTVRRKGDTEFIIEGWSRYVEVDGQADRDDDEACERGYSCDTWEAHGAVAFRGKGSIETRKIDLTWKGRDEIGDGCSFKGRGTATYKSP